MAVGSTFIRMIPAEIIVTKSSVRGLVPWMSRENVQPFSLKSLRQLQYCNTVASMRYHSTFAFSRILWYRSV